jgi:nucleotide-binding universal stress UspA family protein
MFGAVLVPLDGSTEAEAALPLAREIARRDCAQLVLLRVTSSEPTRQMLSQARNYLDTLVELSDGETARAVVRHGSPAQEIVALAGRLEDPLVVLATAARRGIERLVFGSVAEEVVRHAGVPVLLLRAGTQSPTELPRIARIAVPLDGSRHAEEALPTAVTVARLFDAELWLVRVAGRVDDMPMRMENDAFAPGQLRPGLTSDAAAYLAGVAGRLQRGGVRVHTRTLGGDPVEELLAYEHNSQTDLVVIATHARSGLDRALLGSVAQRLVKEGAAPVLLVRYAGAAAPSDAPGLKP